MVLNPNWPLIETAWGPVWDAGGGRIPPDRYVELTAIGTFATGRGRQYQLDQVQAGTSSMTLPNTDGSLDPDNAAGPYAGRILPFQPIRRRAQWPPTINLLNQAQATGGDVGGHPAGAIDQTDTGPRILSDVDTAPQFVTSGTAWQGATVAQFQVTAAATVGQRVCHTEQPAVKPGQTYTMQMRVRNVTPSTTVQVAAGFRTTTAAGTAGTTAVGTAATLVGSATAAWTLVTVTATAAATSAWMSAGVQVVAAPGATASVQVDGWQLEKGPTASAWVQPGVWYPVTSQFAEKWTADWADSGTRGIVQPSGVDALALLSQTTLPDALTAEIKSRSPRFLYRFDDPEGSEQAADATGQYPPVPLRHSKSGQGVVTFGTAITAADPVNGIFTGAPGPVVSIVNQNPATNVIAPASFFALHEIGIHGPTDPQSGWTRMIAYRWTGPSSRTQNAQVWRTADKRTPTANDISIYLRTDGYMAVTVRGIEYVNNGTRSDDGNWHIYFVTYHPSFGEIVVRVDEWYEVWDGVTPSNVPATGSLYADTVGNYYDTNTQQSAFNWSGDIAFCGEFTSDLDSPQTDAIRRAWQNSFTGESTGTRYSRILGYAGYAGASDVDAGLTGSMGPATFAGQDAVSALQAVVDTEGGAHYITAGGEMTFAARSRRYNALTPMYTFGERGDLGEWPYEDCKPDFDATHLGGIVQVTQESTGQIFTAVDDASVTAYFPRTITRTVNASDPLECQDAANYLKSRFAQPSTRVAALKLHPSAYPALWPVCLSLEQGTRIRVMRRPLGAPPITIDCFVEKLDWSQTDGGDAILTLQASRADTTTYRLFAAWHTTLNAAAAAGATTITINAGADNTNPLAAQLPPGQQLTLEPGTANAETVTVKSVAATTSGWTTAVITLTAATTLPHAANSAACEALPAGTTDPTTWDTVAAFDATAFAY